MEKAMVFDILVNVSPFLIYLDVYLILTRCTFEKKICWRILCCILSALIGFSFILINDGYGIFLMSILAVIFVMIFSSILIVMLRIKDRKAFYLILYVSIVIVCIFVLYNRLKLGRIVKIEFIDKLEDIDILKTLLLVVQNDWFKGIAIASLGGIVAGLAVNKMTKKKVT